jgi:hypothetical protein
MFEIKNIVSFLIKYPVVGFIIFILLIIDVYAVIGLKNAEDKEDNALFLISFVFFIVSTFGIPCVYIYFLLASMAT